MAKKIRETGISEKYPRITEGSCVILQRLQVSRNAIMQVREKIEIKHPRSTLLSDKGLWGMVGIIDYIKTGDPEKILEPTLKRQVEKINAETWKKRTETALRKMPKV